MSKPKRKRKYDPKRKLAKFTHSRASKIYCYDAKCFPEMQFGGDPLKSTMPIHIKKKIMYSVGEDVHYWNIMLLIFEEYQDGKRAVITDIIPETIGRSNELNAMLDGDLERRVEGRNPKHVTSWAWYAVPLKNADLDAMRPDIIKLFEDAGAFDRELCGRIHNARSERERMEEALEKIA